MIAGVLRLLDVLMGLREPTPPDPPNPPLTFDEHNQQNLMHLYLELGAEMRALRATEFSIAGLFYGVAAFLLTGNFAVLVADKLTFTAKAICIVATVIFLLFFWFLVHSRVAHDNASYAHLMSRRRYLEKHWFWLGMPGKPENIGSGAGGRGYRMTQSLIALSALSVSTILLLVLTFVADWKLVCAHCRERSAKPESAASAVSAALASLPSSTPNAVSSALSSSGAK